MRATLTFHSPCHYRGGGGCGKAETPAPQRVEPQTSRCRCWLGCTWVLKNQTACISGCREANGAPLGILRDAGEQLVQVVVIANFFHRHHATTRGLRRFGPILLLLLLLLLLLPRPSRRTAGRRHRPRGLGTVLTDNRVLHRRSELAGICREGPHCAQLCSRPGHLAASRNEMAKVSIHAAHLPGSSGSHRDQRDSKEHHTDGCV